MNEPSKQRTYWRYHCSVTYVTQQWRSHENFSFTVTRKMLGTWYGPDFQCSRPELGP